MIIIGIDPDKSVHVASALGIATHQVMATMQVDASDDTVALLPSTANCLGPLAAYGNEIRDDITDRDPRSAASAPVYNGFR